MKRRLGTLALALILTVVTAHTDAQPTDVKGLVAQMQGGGHVIVFRHGATNRDQADTDPLNPASVGKQRLLSDKGREVAQQVGAAFRKLGIPLGAVYTS